MSRTIPAVKVNESPPSQMLSLRVASELVARSMLGRSLGMSFEGKRDLYQALGYSKDLKFDDYYNVFKRGRLGKRIISAPVESTWRGDVKVMEDAKPEETEFEKAWKELNKKMGIIPKLARADKMSRIGEFGVLLMGFNDGKPLDQPLIGTKLELIYLQPYHQGNIQILEWETDIKNPRYGLPRMYSLQIRTSNASAVAPSFQTFKVHYTRCIHIAEGLMDNDVFGTAALESGYNSLQDLEKIAGGSAEMYWQGALGGKAFTAKDGATLGKEDRTAMQTEIDEYTHNLRRYLRLQNIDVQDLSPQVSDPTAAVGTQLDIISGDTGIPKRILIGSERGELASTQDESNWLNRIADRRTQFAESQIFRPFIDMLIKVGVLPPPKSNEYQISWPPLEDMAPSEVAATAKTMAEAIAAYLGAMGAPEVMPVDFFFKDILKLTQDQVDKINKMLEEDPPMDKIDTQIDEQSRLEAAGAHPLQVADRLAPDSPPVVVKGGKVPGKKSVKANDDIVDNFNEHHSAKDGKFTSGGGASASDTEARGTALGRGYRVPPAWKQVWVNPDASADIQVKGKDSKGRTQYIYSVKASNRNAAAKFARLKAFTQDHDKLMSHIKADMVHGAHQEEAKALYLISQTGFRVGGERETGGSVHAFGATTLLGSHASVNGTTTTFNFTGKKGVVQNHTIDDHLIAGMFKGKGEGRVFNTNADKVRNYLHSLGGNYKVKDFRTYVATATALHVMSGMSKPSSASATVKAINKVAQEVAHKLGNTPAMAKNSYIDPSVFHIWG